MSSRPEVETRPGYDEAIEPTADALIPDVGYGHSTIAARRALEAAYPVVAAAVERATRAKIADEREEAFHDGYAQGYAAGDVAGRSLNFPPIASGPGSV